MKVLSASGWRGPEYEIGLNAGHAQALRDALARYVRAARRAGAVPDGQPGGGRRTPASGLDGTEVRERAKAQGIEVKHRGRVSAELVVEFKATTGQESPGHPSRPGYVVFRHAEPALESAPGIGTGSWCAAGEDRRIVSLAGRAGMAPRRAGRRRPARAPDQAFRRSGQQHVRCGEVALHVRHLVQGGAGVVECRLRVLVRRGALHVLPDHDHRQQHQLQEGLSHSGDDRRGAAADRRRQADEVEQRERIRAPHAADHPRDHQGDLWC